MTKLHKHGRECNHIFTLPATEWVTVVHKGRIWPLHALSDFSTHKTTAGVPIVAWRWQIFDVARFLRQSRSWKTTPAHQKRKIVTGARCATMRSVQSKIPVVPAHTNPYGVRKPLPH